MNANKLVEEVINVLNSKNSESAIIKEFDFNENKSKNELLLFVKPEVFMVKEVSKTREILELVFTNIEKYESSINGVMMVGGETLEKNEIMDRHYGYINEMSKNASNLISKEDIKTIKEKLRLGDEEDIKILGAHEYLQMYPINGMSKISELWDPSKSIKLRSGFYFMLVDDNNEKIVMINGFHPAQLKHFTGDQQRLLLVLLRSNTKWKDLRDSMLGATFPEKAEVGSIRRTLFQSPEKFGFEKVTIENNCVHLSAGPFEAAFEVYNFLGRIFGDNQLLAGRLNVIRSMMGKGVSFDVALKCLSNPVVVTREGSRDLFTLTENFDTDTAIEYWLANSK